MSLFRTLKKECRPNLPERLPKGTAKLAGTRAGSKKDALERCLSPSHKRFVAVAHSILRDLGKRRCGKTRCMQEAVLSEYRHWRSFEGGLALRMVDTHRT